MDKPKVLSGQAIVAKGVTKVDASLPEIGLKDVTPSGSWLEQKQIQAALEGRKHLIEVERIEKFGTLSHATWRDDLNLAEVTQKVGGYWQYLGHNVGKTLYLRPEEALYLMEVNCLLLKHNDITVSLQKAYSLLLKETTAITQYKVYASLSRVGYKIFRHKMPKVNEEKSSCHKTQLETKPDHGELTIDTAAVEHDVEQPLTDSSVEILDNKTNENNESENNKHVGEPLPAPDQNNSADECVKQNENKSNEVENNDSNKQNIADIDENVSSSVMDVDQTKSNEIVSVNENNEPALNTENEKTDTNANNIDDEEKCKPIQIEEPKNDETKNIEITNNETHSIKTVNDVNDDEIVMDTNEAAESITAKDPEPNPNDSLVIDNVSTNEISMPAEDTQNGSSKNITTEEINTSIENNNVRSSNKDIKEKEDSMEISLYHHEVPNSSGQANGGKEENTNVHSALTIEVDSAESDVVMDLDTPESQDFISAKTRSGLNKAIKTANSLSALLTKRNQIFHNYVTKLKRLTNRQFKPSDFKVLEKHFENIPDLFQKEVVTVNVPDQQYIPRNIFINKCTYVLNMKQIKQRSTRSGSNEPYNSSDEVNGSHIRRIRSTSGADISQNQLLSHSIRPPPRQPIIFRPYNFWRPQNNLNYVQFNMFFQRPCYSNMIFQSRVQFQHRPSNSFRGFPFNFNYNSGNPNMNYNARKRMRSSKESHFQSIKNLAVRLKRLIMSGDTQLQNIESLHKLLYAYNTRYKARLRLTKFFDVINDENIVETIDLEDDEESACKRRRLGQEGDTFDENLDSLRQLALKMKNLDANNKITSKHRRAMTKAVKTFNKSYDADIYMNDNYEIINKRLISIETDSESDCVVHEPKKVKRKKLRNPFNILKRRLEKQAGKASTSKNEKVDITDDPENNPHISKVFDEKWLPQDKDFGRAEVTNKNVMNSRLMDAAKEEYMFNFIKNHFGDFNNWLEAKIAFLQYMEETDIEFQNEQDEINSAESVNHSGLKPLIDAEDCTDMTSNLEKLRIIKHNKEINKESNLNIHFDVYNRDVQNFRKTNPPKPHFRIICLEESSSFPSTADVMALHSKYEDNVNIVFAIVGTSSISYLQINPIELPVYVSNDDLK